MNSKLKNSQINNSFENRNSKFEDKNVILYLDTSESEAVLAIYELSLRGGKAMANCTAEIRWEAARELSRTLSKKYLKILNDAKINEGELKGISVFAGPGSFTGLRIGIYFANSLAYALNIPIYATHTQETIDTSRPEKIIIPFYGSEPKITKPKNK